MIKENLEKFLKQLQKRKKILCMLFLVLLAAIFCWKVVFAGKFFPKKTIQNQAKEQIIDSKKSAALQLSPTEKNVAPQKDFSLEIKIDSGKIKISNADVYLKYDKTKLKLVSIEKSGSFGDVLGSKILDNGTASFSAQAPIGKNRDGAETFATLHFQALSSVGKTTVNIMPNSGIYGDEKPGINELGKTIAASVIIAE
jgi:hypothetical protein